MTRCEKQALSTLIDWQVFQLLYSLFSGSRSSLNYGSKTYIISYDNTDFVKTHVLRFFPIFPPITKSIVLLNELVTRQA